MLLELPEVVKLVELLELGELLGLLELGSQLVGSLELVQVTCASSNC